MTSMTSDKFTKIRTKLGLDYAAMAKVLGYSSHMRVREFERGYRDVPNHIALLMTAYAEGYRPKNWPKS